MTLAVPKPRKKSAFTLRLEAGWDAVECTHRCDCGYSVTGPTGQAREQMRDHRIRKHPERPAIAKRPKKPKPVQQPTTPPPLVSVSRPNGRVHTERPRTTGRPPSFTKAQIEALYVDQGLSIRACAAELKVWHSTVRKGLDRYGIPRRSYTPRDQSYITHAREAAAWTLYERGHTAMEIASVAYTLWGYTTDKQCERSLFGAFERHDRTMRPRQRRTYIPPFDPVAALEILKEAEA